MLWVWRAFTLKSRSVRAIYSQRRIDIKSRPPSSLDHITPKGGDEFSRDVGESQDNYSGRSTTSSISWSAFDFPNGCISLLARVRQQQSKRASDTVPQRSVFRFHLPPESRFVCFGDSYIPPPPATKHPKYYSISYMAFFSTRCTEEFAITRSRTRQRLLFPQDRKTSGQSQNIRVTWIRRSGKVKTKEYSFSTGSCSPLAPAGIRLMWKRLLLSVYDVIIYHSTELWLYSIYDLLDCKVGDSERESRS